MAKRKKIALISDLHCGSLTGLTPPRFNSKSEVHAGKGGHKHRAKLYKFFEKGVDKYGPWDAVIVNGDAVDGQGKKSGGTEQLGVDRFVQAEMAGTCIRRFGRRPKVFMTYGTGYHTGTDEDWENLVAERVGAERIESEAHYDIDGVALNVRHHLGNTTSPVSRFTAIGKEQLRNLLWHDAEQQPRADLIVRSHVHRPAFCGEPGDWTAIILPALQGLGTKYGARRCTGMPVRFGFAFIETDGKGGFSLGWHIQSLKEQAATVSKV